MTALVHLCGPQAPQSRPRVAAFVERVFSLRTLSVMWQRIEIRGQPIEGSLKRKRIVNFWFHLHTAVPPPEGTQRCPAVPATTSTLSLTKEIQMAEVHVSIKSDASGNLLKFDNPGIAPLPPSAGKPVTATTAGG